MNTILSKVAITLSLLVGFGYVNAKGTDFGYPDNRSYATSSVSSEPQRKQPLACYREVSPDLIINAAAVKTVQIVRVKKQLTVLIDGQELGIRFDTIDDARQWLRSWRYYGNEMCHRQL
jgi:hypothetical protein